MNESSEEAENRNFQIRTSRCEKYEKGAQITISYGRYSNRMLLTNYGFAIKDNKYDYCRVKFPLHSLLRTEQASLLAPNYDSSLCVAFKFKFSAINIKFLQILRGIWWEPHMPAEGFFAAKCWELEEKILNLAENLLTEQLDEFETSLEEDMQLLEQYKSMRQYFAVPFT